MAALLNRVLILLHLYVFISGNVLVADDDFAVLCIAENLEAFPQHVLGHGAWQVVDVKHLAVVLATGKPWQQSGQRTIQNADRSGS